MKQALLYIILFVAPLSIFAQTNNAKKTNGNVPDELIGHWQVGTFSLTNFWNPTTGQYVGNAGEASTSYKISKDGTAEEFFIYNSTSYNCRTEILGYRKGTIKINEAEKSFTFCPTSGYYRTANCFKKDWTRKEYGDKDLYPQYQFTYYWTIQDGNLVVKKSPTASTTTTYKKIGADDAK
jgi:hypothetical protein